MTQLQHHWGAQQHFEAIFKDTFCGLSRGTWIDSDGWSIRARNKRSLAARNGIIWCGIGRCWCRGVEHTMKIQDGMEMLQEHFVYVAMGTEEIPWKIPY